MNENTAHPRQHATAPNAQPSVARSSSHRAVSLRYPQFRRSALATGTSVLYRSYNRTQSAHPYGRGNSNQFAPSTQNALPPNMSLHKAEFFIVNKDLFKIEFTGVRNDVKQAFASLACFISDDVYNFPWRAHQTALDLCTEKGIRVSDIPKGLLREWCYLSAKEIHDDELLKIDTSLLYCLYPFQRDGIKFGISKNGRVLIADDAELGKSIQGLGIARYYREEWPLVIVCTSQKKKFWIESVKRFLPTCTVKSVATANDVNNFAANLDTVFVTSYANIGRNNYVENNGPRVLIFDESHVIKSFESFRTRAALRMSTKASRIILLSSTPPIKRPFEFYIQIRMMRPQLFPIRSAFEARYCGRLGATQAHELWRVLTDIIMIRREMSDVEHMLHPRTRTTVMITDSNINTPLLEELRKRTENIISSPNFCNNPTFLDFFRESALAKAPTSVDYVLNILKERDVSEKVLVFGHHSFTLDTICAALFRENIGYIRIDDTTMNRVGLCNSFQTDPKVRVAVLNFTAAGFDISLNSASFVVFAELHYAPGALLRAENCVPRLGQSRQLDIYYIVVSNTADQIIVNTTWPLSAQQTLNP